MTVAVVGKTRFGVRAHSVKGGVLVRSRHSRIIFIADRSLAFAEKSRFRLPQGKSHGGLPFQRQ